MYQLGHEDEGGHRRHGLNALGLTQRHVALAALMQRTCREALRFGVGNTLSHLLPTPIPGRDTRSS